MHGGDQKVHASRKVETDISKSFLHKNHAELNFCNNLQLQCQSVVPPCNLTRYIQLVSTGRQPSQPT